MFVQFYPSGPPSNLLLYQLVMQSEEDSGEFLMSYFNKLNFEFDLIGRVLRSPAWRPSSSQLAKDYMRNPKQTSIYRLFGAAISERVHFVMTIPIDVSHHCF